VSTQVGGGGSARGVRAARVPVAVPVASQ